MANRPMRILQVMRAPVGGLFRHVADLSRELNARGHQVGLVVDSLASDAQTETRLQALSPDLTLGIHRHAMPRVLGSADIALPFKLRQLGKHLGIEIYHGHGAKGGFHARLAAPAKPGIGRFYTPHGGVLHFDAKSASGQVFHRLERWLMSRTSAIFFESAYAEATYSALIGTPRWSTAVIHNGLTIDEFEPVIMAEDAADFVYVGELRELKGLQVLLEALVPVKTIDGRPATLHVVGDGPDRQAFEAKARTLGLEARVRFAGAGPAREAFAHGRIAVVPSLAESLPYIVMEATAAGLPVIATRVGGVGEIFGPTAGDLVTGGDAVALQRALDAAVRDPETLQKRAQDRLGHVREKFAVGPMVDAIERQYRQGIETA